MSKRRRKTLPIRQGFAIVLALLGFLTLMGELGITGGKAFYQLLKYPLGDKAWLAPFVFFLLAMAVWGSTLFVKRQGSPSKRVKSQLRSKPNGKLKVRHLQEEPLAEASYFNQGVELPKGKLVSLKGFDDYFSSDLELEPIEPLVELDSLGKDFTTYFKEGQELSFQTMGTRLETVKGFSKYFEEVSTEIEQELWDAQPIADEPAKNTTAFPSKREWDKPSFTTLGSDYYPGQVAQLKKNDHKDQIFKGVSPEERAALLGKSRISEETAFDSYARSETIQAFEERAEPTDEDPVKHITDPLRNESSVSKSTLGEEAIGLPTEPEENTYSMNESDESFLDNDTMSIEVMSLEEENEEEILVQAKEDLTEELIPSVEPQNVVEEQRVIKPKAWKLPSFDLLDILPQVTVVYDQDTQKHLEQVLENFGVHAKVIRVARGPVITRYELAPAPGVKISRIVNLADDIALGLAARDVRIEAPIPGKSAIGIEVPNKHPRPVPFREVLETPEFKAGSAKLRVALGKDIGNQSIVANLAKMPHLLVAGATGSGKSVCITAIINSLLFNTCPDEVKFLMVDPKMVELSIYNGIPHLLAPVVTDPKKAAAALKWVVKEMETRYELFAASGVRDIERYNHMKAQEQGQRRVQGSEEARIVPAMPWIVVIIDELADLMMVAADDVEESICRLAQMARAAGIHLVIATQRPSVDVITGVIKANIPSRISFAVSSQIDSRTILDSTGAEKLLGRGDMLYSPQGINKPMRVQGCMVTDDEVQKVIAFWKAQGSPEYLDPEGFINVSPSAKGESAGPDDELFIEAGHLIITTGMASVSYLQRKLKLGYARAARLIDLLEDNGVVGGYEGSKPRQVLLNMDEFEDRFG
ncbi:DNA segregation ATPase, FtsK/SpoIIIE family [Desulfitobacterium dichloroeliminans LMG P-21439]|uniref:DNA segregation ATPase, FtsK/SpoIIIE family n=1 Tax=Desulfitobacterium dichloroeliminans (strain LMG P-21439 / DCA1) TaxID=871963 RepID=L0FA02_DESDL|nr:DNA translocase FtsK [Desulfitobacterium dichloroeliminans]AGA69486.1 DNA segregation ATPase, FtsK/SpoIIIE family [Desulfitobacterium dichloroeliminans LMG P-21439]